MDCIARQKTSSASWLEVRRPALRLRKLHLPLLVAGFVAYNSHPSSLLGRCACIMGADFDFRHSPAFSVRA